MSLPPDLDTALARAAESATLLVATDFDGVLAPFDTDPMNVAPTPGTVASLRALSRLDGVHVAMVSGRDLASLRAVSGLDEVGEVGGQEAIVLIGSHGAETSNADLARALAGGEVTADDENLLTTLREQVTSLVETGHPGVGVEHKTRAVGVHVRGLASPRAEAALDAAREVAQQHPGVRVIAGKSVLELSVSHADKGAAVTALGELVGATTRVYLGDDVTDEDAFRVLTGRDDVTVKVGDGDTAARYRLDDEVAVASLLTRLSALCGAQRERR